MTSFLGIFPRFVTLRELAAENSEGKKKKKAMTYVRLPALAALLFFFSKPPLLLPHHILTTSSHQTKRPALIHPASLPSCTPTFVKSTSCLQSPRLRNLDSAHLATPPLPRPWIRPFRNLLSEKHSLALRTSTLSSVMLTVPSSTMTTTFILGQLLPRFSGHRPLFFCVTELPS